jgi:hypothetical protein
MHQEAQESPRAFYHRIQSLIIKAGFLPGVQTVLASSTFLNGLLPDLRRHVIRFGSRSIEQQVASAQGSWEADYQQDLYHNQLLPPPLTRPPVDTIQQENSMLRARLADLESRINAPPSQQPSRPRTPQAPPVPQWSSRIEESGSISELTRQMKELQILMGQTLAANQAQIQEQTPRANQNQYQGNQGGYHRPQNNNGNYNNRPVYNTGASNQGNQGPNIPTCFRCQKQGHIQKFYNEILPNPPATQTDTRHVNFLQYDVDAEEVKEEDEWWTQQDGMYQSPRHDAFLIEAYAGEKRPRGRPPKKPTAPVTTGKHPRHGASSSDSPLETTKRPRAAPLNAEAGPSKGKATTPLPELEEEDELMSEIAAQSSEDERPPQTKKGPQHR